MHLVLFDLETTGFSPETDAIIQIAAVRMLGGMIQDESFATFVRPEGPIPAEITGRESPMGTPPADQAQSRRSAARATR